MCLIHSLNSVDRSRNFAVMLFNVAPLLDGRNQVGIIVAVFLGFYIKKRFFKSNKRIIGKWKAPLIKDSRTALTPLETDDKRQTDGKTKKVRIAAMKKKRANRPVTATLTKRTRPESFEKMIYQMLTIVTTAVTQRLTRS